MEWKSAENKDDGTIRVPERWLHLYYYEALNILFRFENALRIFVYVVLKAKFGKDWDLAALGDGITIRTETKKRIAQAREHGYLGYEVSSPMLYLNSGELTQIIVSDAYWKHFAPYFKATKAIISTKLQEIGTVRNSLAHFRPLRQDDIDLIKQNSKHVLLEVENCLTQITSITTLVPSNSEDVWYKSIKPIGSGGFSTSLFFTPDHEWVRLQLSYAIPTLQRRGFGSSYGFLQAGNLRTDQILRLYPPIQENCIYVSEDPMYGVLAEDKEMKASKRVSIVFAKATLAAFHAEISDALRDMSLKIESESELISQDYLARGELIESRSISAHLKDASGSKYWRVELSSLQTPLTAIDQVEFWGTRHHFPDDFIASTSQYPWMPSTVSTEETPF